MNVQDMAAEGRRLSGLLDAALEGVKRRVESAAAAERDYRKRKAECWVQAPEGTAAFREAWVNAQTADLRYQRDIASGMERNARDAIRAYQTQISLLQSVASAHRAEAEFVRTAP